MFVSSACVAIGLEIKQEVGKVSAGIPEMSHLVVCWLGRPAVRFWFVPRRMVRGRVPAPGRLWGGAAGAGCSVLVLQSRLEEPGDPLERRD